MSGGPPDLQVLQRDGAGAWDYQSSFVKYPPPTLPQERDRLIHFAAALRNCGYDIANCAARLGVFPRLGVSFWPEMRLDWVPCTDDPIDNLLTLFIDGGEVDIDLVATQISRAFVDAALEMRLVRQRGSNLESDICLFPSYGKYFATDQASKNTAINQVMWLWGESYLLGGLVKRVPRRRAIDLGTGSGIHAILASDQSNAVVGADVNLPWMETYKATRLPLASGVS